MAADCIFCRIVAGDAPASVVYDDAATLAFVDLRQMSAGHTLVVPKHHVADVFDLDVETGAAIMATIVRVARGVRTAVSPDGMNIWQSNGAAAGQEVFHVHFHIVPRRLGDGLLRFRDAPPAHATRTELDAQAERIRAAIPRDE